MEGSTHSNHSRVSINPLNNSPPSLQDFEQDMEVNINFVQMEFEEDDERGQFLIGGDRPVVKKAEDGKGEGGAVDNKSEEKKEENNDDDDDIEVLDANAPPPVPAAKGKKRERENGVDEAAGAGKKSKKDTGEGVEEVVLLE